MRRSKQLQGGTYLKTVRIWTVVTLLALAVLVAMNVGFGLSQGSEIISPIWYDYQIVNVYPHDSDAFTQGLIFRDGMLYESTGLRGQSTLRKVRMETGEVVQEHVLDPKYFAEGLTDTDDSLVQLTWHSSVGFVYDLNTLALRRTFCYSGEGWGLTRDAHRLIMSDGTSMLRFLDPETFIETGHLKVTQAGEPVKLLNELEVVQGKIYANIWKSNHIVVINPQDGKVVGRIDLKDLLTSTGYTQPVGALNGIAYDTVGDRLFVTGKRWPKLFEIKIKPQQGFRKGHKDGG